MDENYSLKNEIEDKLFDKSKEEKQVKNHVSLILISWLMIVALGLFLSLSLPDYQELIVTMSIASIIPVCLLEMKSFVKLSKIKKEKTILESSKSQLVIPKEDFSI